MVQKLRLMQRPGLADSSLAAFERLKVEAATAVA
jgi:hypothetical protein